MCTQDERKDAELPSRWLGRNVRRVLDHMVLTATIM